MKLKEEELGADLPRTGSSGRAGTRAGAAAGGHGQSINCEPRNIVLSIITEIELVKILGFSLQFLCL